MQSKTPLIIVAVVVVLAVIGGIAYASLSDTEPHDHEDGAHSSEHDSSPPPAQNGNDSPASQEEQSDEAAEAMSVEISNSEYTPSMITVKAGATVTWTNRDTIEHNVVSDSGDALSGPLLSQGESWSHTFTEPGTYDYHCTPHPFMKGTVIVTG